MVIHFMLVMRTKLVGILIMKTLVKLDRVNFILMLYVQKKNRKKLCPLSDVRKIKRPVPAHSGFISWEDNDGGSAESTHSSANSRTSQISS